MGLTMCLDTLNPNLDQAVTRGYVVVRRTKKGNFMPLNQAEWRWMPEIGRTVPLVAMMGTWHKSSDGQIRGTRLDANGLRHPMEYEKGFHVWHTIEGALKWRGFAQRGVVIVEVEIAKPTAVGMQAGFEVTVAKERKILRVMRPKKKKEQNHEVV